MKDVNKILDKLEELYPDAHCELEYTTAFELLIATILSAQCTDVRVNMVTRELFKKYNKPEDFASLPEEEIMEEIKTCGLYKSKGKKIKATSEMICRDYNGEVPDTLEELTKLPGVGRKTADVVLSNAFNKDAIAVDTHVFRVANRIGIVNTKTPEKTEFALMDVIPKHRWSHSHHVLIFHGRRMCKARKPECELCPIKVDCDFYKGKE
ncbi:MAG: endonuclease III [Terrisporobacter othiniensis]|uniref:endonuclease III n=1 Tax=Terrisporobacter othiniensis TaxID=1577792 RepID=UPI0029074B64|nr:endonuclease III [Terrisporobacter othiniensis]MDU6985431.1 endonuclease III [Terrisporobacter othiniensis]